MTRAFVTKHLRIQSNGTYKYRRRVPKELQSALGKTEFVKVLGKSSAEAMKSYGPYHQHVEKLLSSTSPEAEATRLVELAGRFEAELLEQGLDPYSAGNSEGEKLSRTEAADRILGRYAIDSDTGQPDPQAVSFEDHVRVSALMSGVRDLAPELTIAQAFAFYLSEKTEPDPYKRKKQEQRFARAQQNLLQITKKDILLTDVKRSHARKLRDLLLERMSVSSVRRNINDVKSVFSLAIQEHDLNVTNPFSKLEYGKPSDAAVDLRHPLPPEVIKSMYRELKDDRTLLSIWTLIHHSGAQSAEILGLTAEDLNLTDPVPHFDIKPHGLRTVKKRSRIRKVPLVGQALVVARQLSSEIEPDAPLFPSFVETKDHDRFSQLVRTRLRKYTQNKKHTIYSLRHNMKDALRRAKVGERVELAMLGHSNERTSSAQYGSSVGIEELRDALNLINFNLPDGVPSAALD